MRDTGGNGQVKVCHYPHQTTEQAKACGCLDCLRYLASIDDAEYREAFRQACWDVLGEDIYGDDPGRQQGVRAEGER